MKLVPLKRGDLVVGKPLPWPLYDSTCNVVLKPGYVPDSPRQLEGLLSGNLMRDLDYVPPGDDKTPPPRDAAQPSVFALEDVRMAIGDLVQVQMQTEFDHSRHYVSLVGYMKDRSVIVSTPVVDGKVMMLRDGQAFIVRLFSGKSVYAFSTVVNKVANTPFPHLHLAYPREVRGVVVRGSARVKVNIIGLVSNAAGRSMACTVRDLSLGGALFAAKEQIADAEEHVTLKLRVFVHEAEHILSLNCRLRSINVACSSEDGGLNILHGVSFSDLKPQDSLVLTALIYKRMVEDAEEGGITLANI